jgi:hypothetical protein
VSVLNRFLGDTSYRAALDAFDHRIAVTGSRGKSSMTRWIHDALHDRGHETFAKITGNHPKTLTNGRIDPVERDGPQVRLYENEALLRDAADALDAGRPTAAVCENHGLREYTMRVFNERFLEPDLVVLTNVRQDHTDTLGGDRQAIARSFARSIPPEATVLVGEQHRLVADYLVEEIEKRGAAVEHVPVPPEEKGRVGAEMVYLLDAVLQHVADDRLGAARREALLDELQPVWHHLPGGRIANAAPANDVESTEMVRRALAGDPPDADRICPFVFCRDDRRARTASFAEYLDVLHRRDLIDRVHVAGPGAGVLADSVAPPATRHAASPDRAEEVLEALLAVGQPVIYMANAVDPFMRALVDATEIRALDTTPTRRDPGREDWARRDRDSWEDVKPASVDGMTEEDEADET